MFQFAGRSVIQDGRRCQANDRPERRELAAIARLFSAAEAKKGSSEDVPEPL